MDFNNIERELIGSIFYPSILIIQRIASDIKRLKYVKKCSYLEKEDSFNIYISILEENYHIIFHKKKDIRRFKYDFPKEIRKDISKIVRSHRKSDFKSYIINRLNSLLKDLKNE